MLYPPLKRTAFCISCSIIHLQNVQNLFHVVCVQESCCVVVRFRYQNIEKHVSPYQTFNEQGHPCCLESHGLLIQPNCDFEQFNVIYKKPHQQRYQHRALEAGWTIPSNNHIVHRYFSSYQAIHHCQSASKLQRRQ
jgi:hypothetical protein